MKKSERKSWESKLISNSVELLRRLAEEFSEYLEKIRRAEPRGIFESTPERAFQLVALLRADVLARIKKSLKKFFLT